jgi:hypothetical protein
MRGMVPLLAIAAVAATGCGSSGGGTLVGLPASEAICRVAKEGLSYRMGAGPVVKPTPEIACRQVDGPQPHVIGASRVRQLVQLRATCPATVGCLSPLSRSSSERAG